MGACRDALCGLSASRQAANSGLLLSHYLQEQVDHARKELLEAAAVACNNARQVYQHAFERWQASMYPEAIGFLVETDGRTVIGLGNESPLETGLTLHYTYGVPVLPGSALKGLAAHYCSTVWGLRDEAFQTGGDYYNAMFGTVEDSGHIYFFDALITPDSLPNCLSLDVMTVHHPNYYQGLDSSQLALPTDFDSPTPIPFLSVAGRFQVYIYCDVTDENGQSWAHLAKQLLLEALADWGIGGKTNAGYGTMHLVKTGGADTDNSNLVAGPAQQPPAKPASPFGCKTGDRIEAVLLSERTNKRLWKAEYQYGGRSWVGPILDSVYMPRKCRPGDRLQLTVKSISENNITFLYSDK